MLHWRTVQTLPVMKLINCLRGQAPPLFNDSGSRLFAMADRQLKKQARKVFEYEVAQGLYVVLANGLGRLLFSRFGHILC